MEPLHYFREKMSKKDTNIADSHKLLPFFANFRAQCAVHSPRYSLATSFGVLRLLP